MLSINLSSTIMYVCDHQNLGVCLSKIITQKLDIVSVDATGTCFKPNNLKCHGRNCSCKVSHAYFFQHHHIISCLFVSRNILDKA